MRYKNTRPSKVTIGGVVFLPEETNDIPIALDEKHPLLTGRRPVLVPVKETAIKPKSEPLPTDFVKAMALIKSCTSIDELASWHATDTRSEIKKAIESRGNELSAK